VIRLWRRCFGWLLRGRGGEANGRGGLDPCRLLDAQAPMEGTRLKPRFMFLCGGGTQEGPQLTITNRHTASALPASLS